MARPRSIQAHRKVVEAAAELFSEHGIDATSMDAIAESSGVSKATIYKHWPDKDALCLEVLCFVYGLDEKPPVFDSGDYRTDLIDQLRYQPAPHHKAMKDKIWPHLMAYSARNHAFGAAWRAKALEPSRIGLAATIKRGEKLGRLRTGVDSEVGIALLLGPIMYRRIFAQRLGHNAPKDLEVHVADAFLAAFAKQSRKDQKPSTRKEN